MSSAEQSMRFAALCARRSRLVTEVGPVWLPHGDLRMEGPAVRVPATGPRVSYRSEAERDFLLLCRTRPEIVAVRARALQISFFDLERRAYRQYLPAFLVEYEQAGAPTEITIGDTELRVAGDPIDRSQIVEWE